MIVTELEAQLARVNTQLREQNLVLREALEELIVAVRAVQSAPAVMLVSECSIDANTGEEHRTEVSQDFINALWNEAIDVTDRAQAALTATSQPQRGKGDRALTERVIGLEQALEFAVRGLKVAQPIVCSMCCPSVKRTSEPWTHRQPCDSLTLTLRTVEAQLSQPASEPAQHLCGARGFGQSLDDRCPGCDATSQEGQHG